MTAPQPIDTAQPGAPPTSKLITDFGPLLLFFGTNWLFGIYWATGVFVAATVVAAGIAKRREGRIPPMMLFTLVIVLVFGGLTIWLHDDTFIKLKVTVLNVLFGSGLLFGLLKGQIYLQSLMGEAFALTARGWKLLTIRYSLFFFFLAAVNEAVWRHVSTDTWVTFKVFGLMGLTLLFTVLQVPLLQRHTLEGEAEVEKVSTD